MKGDGHTVKNRRSAEDFTHHLSILRLRSRMLHHILESLPKQA